MIAKPKPLLYREALKAAEQRIVDALPDIVDSLIARAKEGDAKTAAYLCDRILGKVAGSEIVPADDWREPLTEEAYLLQRQEKESRGDDLTDFLKSLGH